MAITIELPDWVEKQLREGEPDLDSKLRDQLLIDNYKVGKIGTSEIAETLGLATRYEAELWLGARGVEWNYGVEQLEEDRKNLEKLFGPA